VTSWKHEDREKDMILISKEVTMTAQSNFTSADQRQDILWTRGLGGCLGVAAYSRTGRKAFLAQHDPSVLRTLASITAGFP
jgi:hypothetical protein